MTDKFFEYQKNCFIKLSFIESLRPTTYVGNKQRIEITMKSGNVVFCDYDVYLRLLRLLPKIQLFDND